MITRSHLILFVSNPKAARDFYAAVLEQEPELEVPGMTEFRLGPDQVLGLMPVAGIRRLLGPELGPPPAPGSAPTGELYLCVEDPESYHRRALAAGARELSALALRDWGDTVAYCRDPEGHLLAFARTGTP